MEKRRAERTLAGTTVVFSDAGNAPFALEGSVEDLSRGGFHASYLKDADLSTLRSGSRIGFRFHIPTGALAGVATVEWIKVDPPEIGLHFESITEGQEALDAYLSSPFMGVEPTR